MPLVALWTVVDQYMNGHLLTLGDNTSRSISYIKHRIYKVLSPYEKLLVEHWEMTGPQAAPGLITVSKALDSQGLRVEV